MTSPEVRAATWEGARPSEWCARWEIPAFHVFQVAGSTNDIARRLAEEGAPARTVVLAEEQTAGRGRGSRRWHAPPGRALLFSVVLRPRLEAGSVAPGTMPLRIGMAVARAVEGVAGPGVGIKWPNDVQLDDGRKVAGILCEAVLSVNAGYVVAGIGVNVNQAPDDFPEELRGSATSLALASGGPVSRADLLGRILAEIGATDLNAARRLEKSELTELTARDVLRGRRISVDGTPRGTAVGVTRDGALLVRDAHGVLFGILNGTVRVQEP